jgi:very-short-patch-repair endonuclease
VPYLRDQLDFVAMDERRLFPDLDGVAAQMRRYYDASRDRR